MARYEELRGKVGIITGAGRGIGKAIAFRLAHEGVAVVVTDVDSASAEATAKEIRAAHGKALGFKVDVTSQDDVDRMVSKTVSEFGALHILVNNAGVGAVAPILDTDEKTWDWVMDVNAKGVFLCSKSAARQMIKQGQGGTDHYQRFGRRQDRSRKGNSAWRLCGQQACRRGPHEATGTRVVFPPNPRYQYLRWHCRHTHVGSDRC